MLANRLAPIEDTEPVLRAFKFRPGSRETEGAVAAWLVENAAWSDEQRDTITLALSARVETAIRSRKVAVHTCRWFFRGMSVSIILLAASVLYHRWWEAFVDPMGWIVALLIVSTVRPLIGAIITVPLSIILDNRMLNPMRRAVKLLGTTGGSGCIGTLAAAYIHQPMRVAAGSALKLVGARVRPSDYGALPGQTVPSLCGALAKTDPDIALVILNVLETIGDERAIDAVDRKRTISLSPEVQEVATRVLATLRRRAVENRTFSMLLRPSSAAPDVQQMLLRATHEPVDMHEEQLLRVSEE